MSWHSPNRRCCWQPCAHTGLPPPSWRIDQRASAELTKNISWPRPLCYRFKFAVVFWHAHIVSPQNLVLRMQVWFPAMRNWKCLGMLARVHHEGIGDCYKGKAVIARDFHVRTATKGARHHRLGRCLERRTEFCIILRELYTCTQRLQTACTCRFPCRISVKERRRNSARHACARWGRLLATGIRFWSIPHNDGQKPTLPDLRTGFSALRKSPINKYKLWKPLTIFRLTVITLFPFN